jgi:hypothetical protein
MNKFKYILKFIQLFLGFLEFLPFIHLWFIINFHKTIENSNKSIIC